MFVKICKIGDGSEKINNRDDVIFECQNVRIETVPPVPVESLSNVPQNQSAFNWQVWLNAGLAEDRIIPVDPALRRIYVMNDQGRTIDTY